MITLNPNKEIVKEVLSGVKASNGYCPCRVGRTAENKCMCEEFRKQESGECHCGLYIKE